MIKAGTILDLSFSVKVAIGGEKRDRVFAELLLRPAIVSVYMRNNTGSCDKQTQQMQRAAAELDKLGYGLIGLSKDTLGSHLKYAGKLGLSFPLVSDPEHAFAKATESLVEKKMYGKTFFGPSRSAYCIDASGKVLGIVESVDPARHAQQLLELVRQ